MSTDQSPDTEDRPERRTRQRKLTVAGVAMAVLLAGGGGAYWASTASSDDHAPQDEPPALALDGIQTGASSARGIAPGEPMGPAGYRTVSDLPEGPDQAAVHRPDHKVSRADVAKLAKSLGLKGDPRKRADRWEIAPKGAQPRLTAEAGKPGGTWTFTDPAGRTGACDRPVPQDSDDARHKDLPGTPAHTVCLNAQGGKDAKDDNGKAPSGAEAKKAAAPVLAALGLKDATVRAGSAVGEQRTVTASPKVEGLPTYGWDTTVTVDKDGDVVRGSGSWGGTDKGRGYPVTSADSTLDDLNRQSQRHGGGAPEHKPSDTVTNEVTAEKKDPGRNSGSAEKAAPEPATVKGAEFGLSLKRSHGAPVLVPSWIYDVEPAGLDTALKVAHPAVAEEYLKPSKTQGSGTSPSAPSSDPAAPSDPEKPSGDKGGGGIGAGGGGSDPVSQAVESYDTKGKDDRTLTIHFWGGVCDKYKATADESDGTVKVRVQPEDKDSKKVCVKIAKRQKAEVTLDKALDGRKVVDAKDGDALPRR